MAISISFGCFWYLYLLSICISIIQVYYTVDRIRVYLYLYLPISIIYIYLLYRYTSICVYNIYIYIYVINCHSISILCISICSPFPAGPFLRHSKLCSPCRNGTVPHQDDCGAVPDESIVNEIVEPWSCQGPCSCIGFPSLGTPIAGWFRTDNPIYKWMI